MSRTISRRALVGTLFFGSTTSILAAQNPGRQNPLDAATSAEVLQIRSWMAEREGRIHSAYVDFRPTLGRAAAMFDRIEVFVRDGDSHVKQYAAGTGAVMVQVIRARTVYQYTIDPEGNHVDPITRRASPAEIRPLDGFLPTLSSRPAYRLRGSRANRGRRLDQHEQPDLNEEDELVRIAQSDAVFWVDPQTRDVVRFEGYDEPAKPVAEFRDFVIRSEVRFPTRVETRRNGELIGVLVVDRVAINEYVDPSLFEIPEINSEVSGTRAR